VSIQENEINNRYSAAFTNTTKATMNKKQLKFH